ncbi:hypothetical protein [Mycobacterium marinum]|uniref:hypothetical protein n=1 Tax=Mycobacterium marinum TaxID=1781 RepID=UPI0035683DB5
MHIALVRAAAVAVLLSPGFLAVGCGSDSTKSGPTTPTQSTASGASSTTTAQASGGECPAATAVNVSSTNGGYPDGINWSTVYAAADRPLAGLGGDGRAVVVYIGTTKRPLADLKDRKIELAADEAFLKLEFTNGAQNAGEGDYTTSSDRKDPNTFDLSIRVTGRTTVQMSQAKGKAQLVTDGNRVCGNFDIADKWTSASGTFVAEVAT